ncbi:MAG TPA: CTP synthase [Patescibacteria group bacterium]|jgi:CTP synthase|nr:CTP synthase [Patescibacteria group bacterium]
MQQPKFLMIAGGVISGVGKGVATASIAKIFQEYGYKVTVIKIDPYLNYDAGTLRPTEHGEVWVTHDGGEIDQDLGTYERFLNITIPKHNNITSGQIYKTVIENERQGKYLGQTVQFIPHIIQEVVDRIVAATKGSDIALIEIGGTVGDYENVPFLFALKWLERLYGVGSVLYALVTYLPVPSHIHEMKTKPTQQAVRMLAEQGILPDFIICRAEMPIDGMRKKKIEECVHIPLEHIIAAPNVKSVYEMPIIFEKQNVGSLFLKAFGLPIKKQPDWTTWQRRVNTLLQKKSVLKIGVVGKYLDIGNFSLTDSYLSIHHALLHAAAESGISIEIIWLNAHDFESNNAPWHIVQQVAGIIVPGGFGAAGIEGKIAVIEYVRKHNIPFLGLCYGLQLAVVAFARYQCNLKDAHTTEIDPQTPFPVVTLLDSQQNAVAQGRYGATMRLGDYSAFIDQDSLTYRLYKTGDRIVVQNDKCTVVERHRHRYEVNPAYINTLQKAGLALVGHSFDKNGTILIENIELKTHPFFIATQAHPEFTSRFGDPNPLFYGFVQAMVQMPAIDR